MAKSRKRSSIKKQKEGAIELSITTIIVVVIGITLLSLGLVFVRGIFTQLTDTSDAVFDKADTIIGSLDIAGRFSAPPQVEVEQGSSKTFTVTVGHDGSISGPAQFDLQLQPAQGSQFSENQVRAQVISQTPVQLNPGQQGDFVVQVIATTEAPLSIGGQVPAYSLTITANGQQYETSAFLINVGQQRGLFG